MGAQDGMLRALFEAMPPSHRPLWLDARPALRQWVDYIDPNHFGGEGANVRNHITHQLHASHRRARVHDYVYVVCR